MPYSISMATQLEKYARVSKRDTEWFVDAIEPYAHNVYAMCRTSEENNVHFEACDSVSLQEIREIARECDIKLENP